MSESNQQGQHYRIIADLDCFLDTRLGLLIQHFPDIAAKVAFDDRYYERESDWVYFEQMGIPHQQWVSIWDNRDASVLPFCYQTLFTKQLLQYIQSLFNEQMRPMHSIEHELWINTYPYQLDRETQEAIGEEVFEQLPLFKEIKMVYIPHRQLDPWVNKDALDSIWFYDSRDWFEQYTEGLLENPAMSFRVFQPRLHYRMEEDDKITKKLLEIENGFNITEASLSIFMSFAYSDVGFYNIVREVFKDRKLKPEYEK